MNSKKYTPEQDAERHALLDLPVQSGNDIAYFNRITLETLRALKKKKFLDMEDAQNSAPTIGEFMKFMASKKGKSILGLTVHGYIVSNGREDRRISIEGMEHEDKNPLSILEFLRFNRQADECSDYRSWWD